MPFKKLLEFFALLKTVYAVYQTLNGRYSAYTERHMQWSEFREEFVYNLGFLEATMEWSSILQQRSPGQPYME